MRSQILCLLLALSCSGIAYTADPPKPSLEKPVDYVKWVNDEYGKDIKDNAADLYLKAAELLKPNEELFKSLGNNSGVDWTAEQRARLSEYLKTQEPALRQFAEAAGKKDCFFALESESGALLVAMFPELATLRKLCIATVVRARLRLLDGHIDAATDDIVTVLRFAQHAYAQPVLIHYLVGMAVDALAYQAVLDLPRLAKGAVDYERLIARLEADDKAPPRPLRQFDLEKLQAWDTLQRCLKDTNGDGLCDIFDEAALSRALERKPERLPLVPPQSFDAVVADVSARLERQREIFVEDYQDARRRATKADEEIAALRGSVLAIVVPNLTEVAVIQRRLITTRHAARLVVGLHAYRAKHGQWPPDLNDVLTGKSARLNIDPYSNKPFVYKLRDGEPLLYSVSANGVDDGGEVFTKAGRAAWGETGDWIFWPRP